LPTPLGIVVFGEEHFLIRGPKPDAEMARYLVRRWIFPSTEDLLGISPPMPDEWKITTREFREDIEWVIVLSSAVALNPAVKTLLEEVATRGVEITTHEGPKF
jgi:hypothetical protein